jgi:acetone carboxylase gamma subunit
MTHNVISPVLNAATPTWRGMRSYCCGDIDATETSFAAAPDHPIFA